MAIMMACELDAEVISVDSMQVYRDMDIGTAKPTVIERRGVPHHMIDICDPSEDFSVAEFRRRGRAVIHSSARPLIIAGGSGLHFRSLVDPLTFAPTDAELRAELERADHQALVGELVGLDPEADHHVDLHNPRRVLRAVEIARLTGETPSIRARTDEAEHVRRYKSELRFEAVGVDPGERLDSRIDRRIGEMRAGGLVSEVRHLQGRLGRTARSAVGYREILAHLRGEMNEAEAFRATSQSTKKLAKRQRVWFQRDPRIRWIPWSDDAAERAERALEILS